MRRLTKVEKAAAAAVLAMAASVAGAGISLLKKHARLMSEKAAATFKEDEELNEEAELDLEEEWEEDFQDEVVSENGEEPQERQYIKL